ncbi:MAG TPA: MlaD family protein [Mycobacterium sp.]
MSDHRPRRWISVPALASLVVALFATSCGHSTDNAGSKPFCALMRDSVGLYVGNEVTQMGYKIGTVTSIVPRDTDVKVIFALDQRRPIPSNASAVLRSPSILADRSLELVGNYEGGTRLEPQDCIPLSHTSTPLSISQIIGSATKFVNGISPEGSTSLKDALGGVNKSVNGNGVAASELLTRSSALLDNPDESVSQLGQITRNMAQLTTILRANRQPLKEIVQDLAETSTNINLTTFGALGLAHCLPELVQLVEDIEIELGPELQLGLDDTSELLRVFSPHYKGIADMLNFVPRLISGLNAEPPGSTVGGLAKIINNYPDNRPFAVLPYRPPLFRIPSPNGLLNCAVMNATMPGSCADVGGRPYAVDTALLQYVLTKAAQQ